MRIERVQANHRHSPAIMVPSLESLPYFHSAVAKISRSSHALVPQLGHECLALFFGFGSEDPPGVSILASPSVDMKGSSKAWGRLYRAFRNVPSDLREMSIEDL